MDWIYKKDDYIPSCGKSAHIERSILSVIGVLAKLRGNVYGNSGLYSASAPVKLFFTVISVIFLAISRDFLYIIGVGSLALLCISFLNVRDIKGILAVSTAVSLFSLVILLPSIFSGNYRNSFFIIGKIWASVNLVNILAYSTAFGDITRSLRIFMIPRIVILIVDLTLKYIVLLGEFSLDMLLSLKLRNIGNEGKKHVPVSNLAGTLFLKSREMSEETYHAMQCRCFDGRYKIKSKMKFSVADLFYAAAGIMVIAGFYIL